MLSTVAFPPSKVVTLTGVPPQSPPPANTTAEFQVSTRNTGSAGCPQWGSEHAPCPAAVCAEAYNPDEDEDEDAEPRVVNPKTDEQRRRLQDACKHILLFKTLEQVGRQPCRWFGGGCREAEAGAPTLTLLSSGAVL